MKPINTTDDWAPSQTGEEDPLSGIANAPVAGAKKPAGSSPESRVTDRIEVASDSNDGEATVFPDRSSPADRQRGDAKH